MKVSPQSKRYPLNYDQVKKIIHSSREDNQMSSQMFNIDSSKLRTTDNSLFRRCHNSYDIVYKSKFIVLRHYSNFR